MWNRRKKGSLTDESKLWDNVMRSYVILVMELLKKSPEIYFTEISIYIFSKGFRINRKTLKKLLKNTKNSQFRKSLRRFFIFSTQKSGYITKILKTTKNLFFIDSLESLVIFLQQ